MNTNDKIQPTSCASSADELLEILMKEKHNPDVPFHVQGLLHLAYMRIKDAAIVPPVVQAPTDNSGKIIYSLLCTAAMTKHPDATDFDLIKTECRAAAKLLREYKEKEPPTIRCCEKTVEQAGNMVCCGEPVSAPIVANVPSEPIKPWHELDQIEAEEFDQTEGLTFKRRRNRIIELRSHLGMPEAKSYKA